MVAPVGLRASVRSYIITICVRTHSSRTEPCVIAMCYLIKIKVPDFTIIAVVVLQIAIVTDVR